MPIRFILIFAFVLFCTSLFAADSVKDELRLYQETQEKIPSSVRGLTNIPWQSSVTPDDAQYEIKNLREKLEYNERIPETRQTAPISSAKMFAPWTRRIDNGTESPLEPINDAATAGPAGEILLHNGEIAFAETDDAQPARGGISCSFVRYFRSHLHYAGPFGNGWDHNQNQRIVFDADTPEKASQAAWYDGSRKIRFTKSGTLWKPESGAFYQLTVSQNTVAIESASLQKIVFEPAISTDSGKSLWRIRTLASRHDTGSANVQHYRYAPKTDSLLEITDPRGTKTFFRYDKSGRIIALQRGSYLVQYDYDTTGNLVTVTMPKVVHTLARTLDCAVDQQWSYGYEGPQLVSITPPGGPRRNYQDGNRIIKVDCVNINVPNEVLAQWTIETKNENGVLNVTITAPTPSPKTVYRFDRSVAQGLFPVSMSIPSRKATYTYQYNADYLLTEEVSPLGNKQTWKFDSDHSDPRFHGNLLDSIVFARPGNNPLDFTAISSTWNYHPNIALPVTETVSERSTAGKQRLLREVHTEYSDDFEPIKITNGRQVTLAAYNRYGLPIATGDALGQVNLFSYFETFQKGRTSPTNGGLLAETIHDVATSQLDLHLRLNGPSIKNVPFPKRTIAAEPVKHKTQFKYDANGLVVSEIDDDGFTVDSIYNKVGLLLAQYDSRSDLDLIAYDPFLRKISQSRRISLPKDARYLGMTLPDLRGRFYQEQFERDPMGRLTVWKPTLESVDGTAPPTVRYERYPSGEVKIRRTADGVGSERVFDAETGFLNEERTLASRKGEASLLRQVMQRYDAEGFLEQYRDDNEAEYVQNSDPFGREFSQIGPDGIEHRTFRDGLGRIVRTESIAKGKTIAASESVYDIEGNLITERVRRLGETLDESGKQKTLDTWLISGEYRYDEAGQKIASRSSRDNAWTLHRFDGLGRIVSATSPEGDVQSTVYDKGLAVIQINRLKNGASGKDVAVRTFTYFDERRNPYLSVQIGTEGQPAFERSIVKVFDTRGNTVQSAVQGQMKESVLRNSMGWSVLEKSVPLSVKHGEQERKTETSYDAVGKVLHRTVFNSPLVLFKPTSAPTADFVPRLAAETIDLPQMLQYEYDDYGRLLKTIQPDGLVKTHEYTQPGSMLAAVTSTHLDDPSFKHVVGLRYDKLRRVTEIYDGVSRKQVQLFQYDDFGSITTAEDRSSPRGAVIVQRRYDNLSNLLTEDVEIAGKRPYGTFVFDLDAAKGVHTFRILGDKWAKEQWTKTVRSTDKDGRLTTVGLDDTDPFCTYSYLGSIPVSKKIPTSGIELNVETNSFLDPNRYEYRNTAQGKKLCSLDYLIDAYGRVSASTWQLDYGRWERSQYFEHDATSALIAECHEESIPKDLSARRKEILGANDTPVSWRTRWLEFDQVGNLSAQYRKLNSSVEETIPPARQDRKSDFTRSDATYYSSAPTFPVSVLSDQRNWPDKVDSYQPDAKSSRELASNRIATSARDSGETTDFKYDRLGRLTEYDIKIGPRKLRFKLQYDLLGRLVSMTGDKVNSHDTDKIDKEGIVRLQFLNDSFNRRVLKEVWDQDKAHTYRCEATGYVDREPVLVVEKKKEDAANWTLAAQYLWGASTRETLTAVLPRGSLDLSYGGDEYEVYSLLQDRMLSVILCTSLRNGKVEIHDVSSYWGFGENNTTASIESVESSNTNDAAPIKSFDKKFDYDDDQFSAAKGSGRILISLDRPAQLEQLTIWAQAGLPTNFKVYVVPETVADPINNGVASQYFVTESHETTQKEQDRLYSTPVPIPLGLQYGKHIVLEWRGTNSDFSINEFEVTVQPYTLGNLGFAGSWLDKETGLYYQGSRYRLPSMGGKFISPDPLGYFAGDNLYAYANNDPLTWHDPDGEFWHVLVSGAIGFVGGGIIGGGGYALHCWWTGEEFSWAKFGVYTAAGAVGGGLAGLTFGLTGSPMLAGAAGGFGHGFVSGAGIEALNGGSFGGSMLAGLKQGAVGGALGAVGGGLVSKFGAGPLSMVLSGTAAGGTTGAAYEGGRTFYETGSFHESGIAALRGGARGAVIGGAIAGGSWAVGRASGMIRPLKDYPKDLPDPRSKGLLVRTKSERGDYGGVATEAGKARHHIKPLALGGTDTPSNIKMIDTSIHRQPHPGKYVNDSPMGTMFY